MNNNHHQQQQQQFQQNMQMGSGLTRYQSAPSSYFSSLLNSTSNSSDTAGFGTDDFEQLFNPPASTPATRKIFSRFVNTVDTNQGNCSSNINLLPQLNSEFIPPRKSETELHQPHQQLQRQQSNDYSSVPNIMYHSHNSEATIPSSYSRLMGSINSNSAVPVKMEGGRSCGSSNLLRHSSSPAGLFDNINIKNEIAVMGNFGTGINANAEASFSSASRFKSHMDFSSRQTSSSGMMATISEIGSKGTGENNPGSGNKLLDENRDKDSNCIPGYPIDSWDDSVILSDNFLKGLTENDQGNEGGNRPTTLLSHHLSLPKSSAELFAMEQLLQDSVPCKIRAKRGFATHPRSIAERVRRTKISQRMRKLQELVPNMEKQTNTADMLDLAVDYIKDLQRQVKTLSDNREKCSCSAKREIIAQRERK